MRGTIRTFLFAAVCAGCGPAAHSIGSTTPAPDEAAAPARAIDLRPLDLELRALTVRGDVQVLTRNGWSPLQAGQNLAGVAEIRASRRGAVLAIGHGDAAGRLWLRAGARVRIGSADDGVHVSMLAGRARLRRHGAQLAVAIDTRSGAIHADGDYVLEAARGGTAITPTAARPELADWALALDLDDTGAGVGKMETHGDDGKAEALALRKVSVKVTTHGDMATTEVEHIFYNPAGGRPREGTFRFPVPDGAMLTGMAMEVDGKLVEGEIVERDKAREIYDEVVDKMEDPALLEWEEGNWFKLRVFPIAPAGEKRVIIRYTAPLVRGSEGFEYDYGLAIANAGNSGEAPGAIGDFSLTIDGKEVSHEAQLAGGLDVSVPIAPDTVPVAMKETRADGEYTAVRIAPDLAALAAPARGPRSVAIIVDTSRSALEGKALADQELAQTLGELEPGDRFVVLASDVGVQASSAAMTAATPDAIDGAKKFVDAIEPDGASDVGAALAAAAALRPSEVVYVGDGIPTWGEQDQAALGAMADQIGAPIHAALIGKGASSTLWSELAGRTGGRAMVVRSQSDAARFALVDAHAGEIPRLAAARISVDGDPSAVVFPAQAMTLYQGDELIALVKSAHAPTQITLTGMENGKAFAKTFAVKGAVVTPGVAQRWGQQEIGVMEEQGAERDAIVAMSRDLGVLSRYTSLLVLENDEAYKAHEIERKNKEQELAENAPTVTGGDLDTLGARRASLSPDEIQPGDPEIKIPAPADARSVVVSFPFGETKLAVWDEDVDAWMVRFLIDKDTPDGVYQARVTITRADGSVQVMTLPYTVDTEAPAVALRAEKTAGGYRITATQIAAPSGSRRKDADRVEVVLPDGSILQLAQTARGKFEGEWTTAVVGAPVTLRVVVRDHALNQDATELVIP